MPASQDSLAALAELARSSDGPVPTWFEDWLEAESEALMLRIWQPIIVPGLLQTADYARALFLATQADTSDDAIEALVIARLNGMMLRFPVETWRRFAGQLKRS